MQTFLSLPCAFASCFGPCFCVYRDAHSIKIGVYIRSTNFSIRRVRRWWACGKGDSSRPVPWTILGLWAIPPPDVLPGWSSPPAGRISASEHTSSDAGPWALLVVLQAALRSRPHLRLRAHLVGCWTLGLAGDRRHRSRSAANARSRSGRSRPPFSTARLRCWKTVSSYYRAPSPPSTVCLLHLLIAVHPPTPTSNLEYIF